MGGNGMERREGGQGREGRREGGREWVSTRQCGYIGSADRIEERNRKR